jgi:hypothetical protein
MGLLRLDQITGCSILIGGDRLGGHRSWKPYGKVWRPTQVRLEVNGQEVVSLTTSGQQFGMLSSLDLQYETAKSITVPPTMKPVEVRTVRQLPPRVNSNRAQASERVSAAPCVSGGKAALSRTFWRSDVPPVIANLVRRWSAKPVV